MEKLITDVETLSTISEPLKFIKNTGIETEEGNSIIAKIKEVMENDSSILNLAAPQIGINKRILCIRFSDTIKTFINPIITKKEGGTVAPETFASMPGKEILVGRPDEITIVYYNDEFKYEDNKLIGPAARLFDQSYQLLDGVLPSDLGLISDVELDGSLADLSEEEVEQVKEIYNQFITAKKEALQKEIDSNEEAQKQYKQLKFTEKVVNGDIQIVESDAEAEARVKAEKIANQSMLANLKQMRASRNASLNNFLNKKGK